VAGQRVSIYDRGATTAKRSASRDALEEIAWAYLQRAGEPYDGRQAWVAAGPFEEAHFSPMHPTLIREGLLRETASQALSSKVVCEPLARLHRRHPGRQLTERLQTISFMNATVTLIRMTVTAILGGLWEVSAYVLATCVALAFVVGFVVEVA
jgi:hypothetical protein